MSNWYFFPDKIIYKPRKKYFCYKCKKIIKVKHIIRKQIENHKFYIGRFHINCLKRIDKLCGYCYCV